MELERCLDVDYTSPRLELKVLDNGIYLIIPDESEKTHYYLTNGVACSLFGIRGKLIHFYGLDGYGKKLSETFLEKGFNKNDCVETCSKSFKQYSVEELISLTEIPMRPIQKVDAGFFNETEECESKEAYQWCEMIENYDELNLKKFDIVLFLYHNSD